jgi:hypothetical protein
VKYQDPYGSIQKSQNQTQKHMKVRSTLENTERNEKKKERTRGKIGKEKSKYCGFNGQFGWNLTEEVN